MGIDRDRVDRRLSLDGREVLSLVILAIAAAIRRPSRASPAARRARPERASVYALPGGVYRARGDGLSRTRLTLLGWAWAGITTLIIAFGAVGGAAQTGVGGCKNATEFGTSLSVVLLESLAVLGDVGVCK